MEDLYRPYVRRYWSHWRRTTFSLSAMALLIVFVFQDGGIFQFERLREGLPAMRILVGDMLPPDFTRWPSWWRPLLDTLTMSLGGTALALLFSLPLSLLAAKNTSPYPLVYWGARFVLNVLRAIPELVLGIVFVAAVGFGPLAGILALCFHSVGMMGKFFAETVEHVEQGPLEAVRASGASTGQVLLHGTLPLVLPRLADVVIYRWEHNIRASTVMGMVGAGGIGTELIGSLRIMQYREVAALLIVILALVTLVDGLSAWLRTRIQ